LGRPSSGPKAESRWHGTLAERSHEALVASISRLLGYDAVAPARAARATHLGKKTTSTAKAGLVVPGAVEVVLELMHQHVGIGGRHDHLVGGHVAAVNPSHRS